MQPKASLIRHERSALAFGFIMEIKVWRLPRATAERPHGLKYSLFFGHPGERVIGYDNESGKGDHRHYRNVELPYRFVSLGRLLADFRVDVEKEMMKWMK